MFDPGGQFCQSTGVVSDSSSFQDLSLKVHNYRIMLTSRPVKINDNHSGLLSTQSYNKLMDEAFVIGVPMKALSIMTGDSVSAVCECQEAASGPLALEGQEIPDSVASWSACLIAAAQRL